MQRQHPPLYPNEQESASLQTTVTRVTVPHCLSTPQLSSQEQHRRYTTNLKCEWLNGLNFILNRCSNAAKDWVSTGVGRRLTLVTCCKSSWLPSRCTSSTLYSGCACHSAALIFIEFSDKGQVEKCQHPCATNNSMYRLKFTTISVRQWFINQTRSVTIYFD